MQSKLQYQYIHIFCQSAFISEWVLLETSDFTTTVATEPFLRHLKHFISCEVIADSGGSMSVSCGWEVCVVCYLV